jgi:uncharacterized protein YegL
MADNSTFEGTEGIVRRQMVLFFIVDTSGSMEGTKIGEVNNAIREVIPELKDVGGSDVDLKIACLKFSNGCEWMHPAPVSAENFQWVNVLADGVTDLGATCRELNKKMSRNAFLSAPSASVAPVLLLMSDGDATDDYGGGLEELRKNNWYQNSIRVAIAIGDDANKEELAKFTGNREAVITVHTPEALRKWIRKISVTSSKIGSRSQIDNGQIGSRQDAVIDELKNIEQQEPDLSQTSTSADDWD